MEEEIYMWDDQSAIDYGLNDFHGDNLSLGIHPWSDLSNDSEQFDCVEIVYNANMELIQWNGLLSAIWKKCYVTMFVDLLLI